MRIGIFANPIILENRGVGRYARSLVFEVLKNDPDNEYILLANFGKKYAERKKDLEDFAKSTGNLKAKICISRVPDHVRNWLSGTFFPVRWLYSQKIDVFFALFSTHISKNGYKKQICVFHDLVFVKNPETQGEKYSQYYRNRTQTAIEKCQKLICVSKSTLKDLENYFPSSVGKTAVVYPAFDQKVFFPGSNNDVLKIKQKYNISKPYILAVGTLEPRKNLEKLIDAYLALPEDLLKKYQLVLTGQSGWNNENLLNKIDHISKDKLIKTGFVPDRDLALLYRGATVFAYPSKYEGFGLPVLEAMASGAPVITSNVSSLPEVTNDAAILINPQNVIELTGSIKTLLLDEKRRKDLIDRGLIRAKQFSWEKSAKKMIEIFMSKEVKS